MAQFDQPHLLAPNRKETKKEEQLTHVTGCDNNSGLLTFYPHSLDSGEKKTEHNILLTISHAPGFPFQYRFPAGYQIAEAMGNKHHRSCHIDAAASPDIRQDC